MVESLRPFSSGTSYEPTARTVPCDSCKLEPKGDAKVYCVQCEKKFCEKHETVSLKSLLVITFYDLPSFIINSSIKWFDRLFSTQKKFKINELV